MPLETEQAPTTRELSAQEQHDAARAFIAEASAEIERLTSAVEEARQSLPEQEIGQIEPSQAQIDDVIAGAEALTIAAAEEPQPIRQQIEVKIAEDTAAEEVTTAPLPEPEDHNLSPDHVEAVEDAIDKLDSAPPEPPAQEPGDGENSGNNGDQPPNDTKFSYDRASVEADATQFADLYAEKRISDDLERGNVFSKMLKRTFEGNVARQFYRERYKLEYLRLVEESNGEIYAPIEQLYGMDAENATEASKAALRATLERVMSEDPRMRREQEGMEALGEDAEAENKLRTAIRDLSLRYVTGKLDDETLLEERDKLFAQIEGLNAELFGKGIHTTDNLLELAQNMLELAGGIQVEAEHSEGLERVEAALQQLMLKGAVAKSGANTELKQTIFDRLSRRIHTSRIGGTAIATSILFAGAIVFSGTRRAAQSTTASAMRLTLIGGAAAGTIAGANEFAAFRREAAFARTEHAYGVEHETGENRRRDAMEAINYEAYDVPRALEEMRIYIGETGEFSEEAGDQDLLNAQALVTRMRVLMEYGDKTKIDLLRFSGIAASAGERLDLMQSLCELELAIEGRVAKGGEIVVGEVEGLQTSQPIAEALELQRDSVIENMIAAIGEDVSAKDTAYNKLMARRVATAFVAGTVAGAVVGAVIQEGVALASPAVTGVFEQQTPGQSNTLLNSLIFGQKNSGTIPGYGNHSHLVPPPKGSSIHLKIPNGLDAQFGPKNTVDLIDKSSGKIVANDLEFGKNGHLTPASLQELNNMGVKTHEVVTTVKGGSVSATANEFYNAHKGELIHTKNSLMMNDTNHPDLNELRFYAAGKDGSWIDSKGNVRIRVDGITENGSFQTPQSVNAVNAVHNGTLKVFMSPDKAHGLDSFAFTVKEHNGHYEVVIPKSSAAHQLFSDRNGGSGASEGFNGRYLGTAVDRGTNARGVHNFAVINSIQGSNDAKFTIPTTQRVVTTNFNFPPAVINNGETLPIISVPVYPRRGIGAPTVRRERLLPRPELVGPNPTPDVEPTYYGGYATPEHRREWEEERSPRLKENPDAKLNPSEELHWYREQLIQSNGPEYVADLEAQIDSIPELRDLPATTKAIVCIPIAAASESENIYRTLSLYAQQEGVESQESTILLHVNWVDEALNDPTKRAAIEKTKAEIERARADFPGLRIAIVETEWEKSFMDTQSGIIGHVARKMADVAMLSSTRAIDVGTINPDQDILVIRNDADAQGMSRHYLRNMIKNFEEHVNADAFVGGMRWETAQHSKYPGFGVSSNFREIMQALTGRPGSKAQVPTIGINHAIRVSMLAAVGGLGTKGYTGAGSDDLEVQGRVYAARDEATRGQSSSYESGYGGGEGTTQKRPIRYVIGAQIDSAADRVMAAYFGGGNGFTDAWSDFDKGGYKEPSTKDIPDSPEDPRTHMQAIASRIERDISNMATNWFNDPARVRTGLAFMFPDTTKDGHKVYNLTFSGGRCTFKLTPEGMQWLKNRLMRDSKGRYDPFGSRAARALYGKVKPDAAKQPLAPTSPLVQPT